MVGLSTSPTSLKILVMIVERNFGLRQTAKAYIATTKANYTMTKYITLKLTEDQAQFLLNLLSSMGDVYEGLSDQEIAFSQRIGYKLAQAKS